MLVPGKKARAPAWCDRVLYSSAPGSGRVQSMVRPGETKKRRTVPGLTILDDIDSQSSLPSFAHSAGPVAAEECDALKSSSSDELQVEAVEGITLLKYSYINGLFHSDHRPVYAEFKVELLNHQ